MIRKLWPGFLAVVVSGVYGATRLHDLPPEVASHWDLHGAVNGYMPRLAIVILMPFLGLVVGLVLALAPRLDPRYRNFPLHAGSYWLVVNAIMIFLAATHVLILGYNLGWPINLNRLVGIGLGVLFVVLGNVMTRVRPNWIFGVRTPWTLSSDVSWRETHRLAGYLFVGTGLAVLVTSLAAPNAMFYVLIAGAMATAGASIVWSYIAWRRDPEAQRRAA